MAVATGTAILGAAALGAGGSALAANKQSKAAKEAAAAQRYGANAGANAMTQANLLAQREYQPFTEAGLTALPFLQYASTGVAPQALNEQELQMMESLSGQEEELRRLQAELQAKMDVAGTNHNTRHWGEKFGGPLADVTRQLDQLGELRRRQTAVNAMTDGGPFKASPLYQWQQEQGEKAINRSLSARGRGNSTFGVNALSDFNRGLGAEESNRQYGRLLDLVNIGRGSASQAGAAQMSTGSGVANMNYAAGNAQAQGINSAGQTQASLYQSLGQLPLNAMNAYQNYQLGQNLSK